MPNRAGTVYKSYVMDINAIVTAVNMLFKRNVNILAGFFYKTMEKVFVIMYNKNNYNTEVYPMEENNTKTKINWIAELYDLLDSVVLSAVCVLVIFTLVFRIFIVSGSSMFPTLKDGERLVVSDLFYEPEPGDIICFYNDYKDEVLVKRVIATAGQTVDISDDLRVLVDGKELPEDYIGDIDTRKMSTEMPYTVEENCVFVMGDNRGDSMDSRDVRVGTVNKNEILGRLIVRLFPRFGTVK